MAANRKQFVIKMELKDGKLVVKDIKGISKEMDKIPSRTDKARTAINKLTVAYAAVGIAAIALAKDFIAAANAAEQYQVRLKVLLRSQEEGNRMFKEMSEFAGRVPFEFERIMGSATALAGVMRGGVDEVRRWMPLIADLAAATGLSIDITTSQVIRMYSAGAASADMFRERGVLAMLGFQAGVHYSAEETRRMMFESWEKMNSQFRGATDELAETWKGKMSMLSDAWFQFQVAVMEGGLLEYLKDVVDVATKAVRFLSENITILEKAIKFTLPGPLSNTPDVLKRAMLAEVTYTPKPAMTEAAKARGRRMLLETFPEKYPVPARPGIPGMAVPAAPMPPEVIRAPAAALETGMEEYIDRMFFFQREWEQAFNEMFGDMDRLTQKTINMRSSAMMMGDSFGNAFAMMASGAQGAGDAISKAMLGALGQIATMWGRYFIGVGTAGAFIPGGQVMWGAVAKGAALMALGGTISGMAGGIGGRGGGGYGGYGGGYRSSGFAGGPAGAGGAQVFIINNGRAAQVSGSLAARQINQAIDDRELASRVIKMLETGEAFNIR